jgi:hypothetical protein
LDFKESLVNDSLEALRAKKEIGQSLEAEIEIHMPVNDPRFKAFQKRLDDLAEILIVSQVNLIEVSEDAQIQLVSRHAKGKRCPRSWRWVPDLVSVEPWGEVSPRCAEVLAKLA